jgi:hypothetical protein
MRNVYRKLRAVGKDRGRLRIKNQSGLVLVPRLCLGTYAFQGSALKIDSFGHDREAEPPGHAFPGRAWERESEARCLYPMSKLLADSWERDRHPGLRSGVQILDSGSCPGYRSGAGRNDEQEAHGGALLGFSISSCIRVPRLCPEHRLISI